MSVVAYAVFSLAYMFVGRPNADEGWYLLAGRLVYSGQLPYRDFAFTQTPLLAYIYGLPQVILSPSILLGRATSVVLSIGAFIIWLIVARKRSGAMGAIVTAMLLVTFTFGLYHNAIVKTYALVTFLFSLTFLALTLAPRREWFALVAAAAALAAALTRLSALPFAIVILAYLLVSRRPSKVKLAVGLLSFVVLAGFVLLYSQDSEAARWNLVGYHTVERNGSPLALQLNTFLLPCTVSTLRSFLPYLILWLLCLLFTKNESRKLGEDGQQSLLFVLAIATFAGANFVAGNCHIEYLVPAVYVVLPFIGMSFTQAYQQQRSSLSRNMILRIILFAIMISEAMRGGWQFVDLTGGQLPLTELREVAYQVRTLTSPSDRIMALESLWVAVDADREPLPGLTMAQFSLYEGDADQARRLKLVNGEIILQYLRSGAAKVVVFTDIDWVNWERIGVSDQVEGALQLCYEPSMVRDDYGQWAERVYLYVRGPSCQS